MGNMYIAAQGSKMHSTLARFEDKKIRAAIWNSMLIDDAKGNIVNNVSGSLHYDDHKRMLDDVVAARKYMPTVFDALSGIPGVGVTVSLFETLVGYSDMNEFSAKTSMDGSNRETNKTDYAYNWVPQPIYHCDFHIPWRQGGYAYKQADGSSEAAMQVALERDKTMVLGNTDIKVNVNGIDAPLYGLTNHPATLALPAGIVDWALEANADQIYKDAVDLVKQLFANRIAAQVPNSVLVFVANDVITNLDLDYSAAKGDKTILERIKSISAIRDVVPSQWLPAGAVLMVEATPMTLRIPRSTDITVAPWLRNNDMEDLKFTAFAASTIQVREDRNNNTGLLYATK